ncbi:MAG: hypothetical protein K9H25_16290 [Rhodospirillum sp.]|nr:hypothetical protein [Rhodospirillum sp.]MCF8489634.1 hypothetical protein [Rhodospirillum sp.]
MSAPDTLLTLEGAAILGKWSARGASHTLTPLRRGEFWRDQGGTARFAPLPGTKYALTVSASDVRPPAFAGLWPGQTVTATCASRLGAVLAPGVTGWTAERDFAPDWVRCHDETGADHPVTDISGRTITTAAHDGPVTVVVRPVLTLMVRDWSLGLLEWDGRHPWRLVLEEV